MVGDGSCLPVTAVAPLHAKSETFPTLLHFFAWVSTQFGLTIKAVQCDNGREFDNSTSCSFFLSRGVQAGGAKWWKKALRQMQQTKKKSKAEQRKQEAEECKGALGYHIG